MSVRHRKAQRELRRWRPSLLRWLRPAHRLDRLTAAQARKPCRAAWSVPPRICRRSRRWERKSISGLISMVWPWWPTPWFAASCPLRERRASYSGIARRVVLPSPRACGRFRATYRTRFSPDSRAIPRIARPLPPHLHGGFTTRWMPSSSRCGDRRHFCCNISWHMLFCWCPSTRPS